MRQSRKQLFDCLQGLLRDSYIYCEDEVCSINCHQDGWHETARELVDVLEQIKHWSKK